MKSPRHHVARSGAAGGRGGRRLFPCLFCGRTFFNSQALSGHQNAHKKDHRVTGDWNTYVYSHPEPETAAVCDPCASWAAAPDSGGPAATTPTVAGTPHGGAPAELLFATLSPRPHWHRDAGSARHDICSWPMMGSGDGGDSFVASRKD